jgi:hypothetical protein
MRTGIGRHKMWNMEDIVALIGPACDPRQGVNPKN